MTGESVINPLNTNYRHVTDITDLIITDSNSLINLFNKYDLHLEVAFCHHRNRCGREKRVRAWGPSTSKQTVQLSFMPPHSSLKYLRPAAPCRPPERDVTFLPSNWERARSVSEGVEHGAKCTWLHAVIWLHIETMRLELECRGRFFWTKSTGDDASLDTSCYILSLVLFTSYNAEEQGWIWKHTELSAKRVVC